MADYNPRSFLRNSNGPQVVDTSRESSWSYSRSHKDAEDREHRRGKKSSGEKKHKSRSDAATRHRSNKTYGASHQSERPVFRLDVLSQPNSSIVLGMDVGITVLLSLQYPAPELVPRSFNCDTNRLLAVASLVAETRNAEPKAMEAGSITGPRLADSLRQVPTHFAEGFRQSHPCRLILGFYSLSELVIRQSGYYRIRTTILQAPAAGSCASGPTVVLEADSDLIRVDRRPSGLHSRRA